jgi:hypothetical protein
MLPEEGKKVYKGTIINNRDREVRIVSVMTG